jgi:hypothetical protein
MAREVKTGYVDLDDFIKAQLDKDQLLVGNNTFAGVEWHFLPSNASGTLGPSKALLDELRRRGIPFYVYLPVS